VRRFLYISPYFPPQRRVGALRPLKFARHLPSHGWSPVILADLRPGDATSAGLLEQLPEAATVRFDYSRGAAAAFDVWRTTDATADEGTRVVRGPSTVNQFWNPEWVPLGEHLPRIPYAVAAGQRALNEFGSCEAIVVNADPYAALIVGQILARRNGLPLICDLRDPWSVCDLRRPRRPALQRTLVDRLERGLIESSARYIVNSEATAADYRAHHRHVPEDRFEVIRNHADAELIRHGAYEPRSGFTILFMGNFRRFLEGEALLEALGRVLSERGDEGPVRLEVTGRVSETTLSIAREFGVDDALVAAPFVPYLEVGSYLETADLLVSLMNESRLRLPSKIFDYATTDRPILSIGDHPELASIVRSLGGVSVGLRDVDAIAAALREAIAAGANQSVDRAGHGLDSTTASAKLAAVLDSATAA
jgi:hypothetical protein